MKDNDYSFVLQWVKKSLQIKTTFYKRIMFSDKAAFSTNGILSSQNMLDTGATLIRPAYYIMERNNMTLLFGWLHKSTHLSPVAVWKFFSDTRRPPLVLLIEVQCTFNKMTARVHMARTAVNCLNNKFGDRWVGTNQ